MRPIALAVQAMQASTERDELRRGMEAWQQQLLSSSEQQLHRQEEKLRAAHHAALSALHERLLQVR